MCDITTGIMVAGLVMGAYGQQQQAEGQKNAAKYSAAVSENNGKIADIQAQDAIRRGDEEANKIARQANMMKGVQRNQMAAAGLELTEGTAQELQDQTDFFSLIDQDTARMNAKTEAWGIRQQGNQFRNDANMARSKAAGINPNLAAVGTLMSGSGAVADRWYSTGGAKKASTGGTNWYSGTSGMGD